jgi:hypothetical protein
VIKTNETMANKPTAMPDAIAVSNCRPVHFLMLDAEFSPGTPVAGGT